MKINNLLEISKNNIKGKIIAFPTDTVYGVGALIDDLEGIKKIYELKHRDPSKPLAILAPSIESILPYIEYPKLEIFDLMEKYWPGALTIIFNKNNQNKVLFNKEFETIAFRIPASSTALMILEKYGPMATTSVNISGSAPINTYDEIKKYFNDQIKLREDRKEAESPLIFMGVRRDDDGIRLSYKELNKDED